MKRQTMAAVLVALLALGTMAVCIDVAERARSVAEIAEQSRQEGYADCLTDVAMLIAGGGGIDEVLAFARRRAAEGFARMTSE